jgi:hypothetical protein
LIEVFENEKNLMIVTKLMQGGELYDMLMEKGVMKEN